MNQKNAIAAIKAVLPAKNWTEDRAEIAPHLKEWRDKIQGQSGFMVKPSTAVQVSDIVKICANYKTPIVPQGGNTGLVGGQIPMGEILLSTRNLNRIRSVSATEGVMIAEAGVTLSAVQDGAAKKNRKFPLSLASEGSCTIGGNLSTNAGGVHVLKYGTTKDLVFGVEAVLPSGEIYNGLTSLRKDNTGYDLSRLFLGAEGTLGIITAAALKLFPQPGQIQRAMVGVKSIADALSLLDTVRANGRLAMFEVMPHIGLELVTTHIPNMRGPFTEKHPWYALLDWELDAGEDGASFAEARLGRALESGLIQDAVIAKSETEALNLLALRENMSAAQKFNGGSIKHDITIPLARLPEFFNIADKAMQGVVPGCRPVGFGHLGDGNIHYNIAQPAGADKDEFLSHWDAVERVVLDIVDSLGGSISAEHGIGTFKREALRERADPVKLSMLRAIKSTFDPNQIMNPRVLI